MQHLVGGGLRGQVLTRDGFVCPQAGGANVRLGGWVLRVGEPGIRTEHALQARIQRTAAS